MKQLVLFFLLLPVLVCAQSDFEKVEKLADVSAIGYMTDVKNERVLIMKSDQIVDLTAPGFGQV